MLDQKAEAPQLLVKQKESGIFLETYLPSFEGDESEKIRLKRNRIVEVLFSFGQQDNLLFEKSNSDSQRIVVDFPWTVGAKENHSVATIMSPAAFGLFISLCSREFVPDVDRYIESVLLNKKTRCIGSRELYSLSQPHLTKGAFPESLVDAWAKYIEVGEF